MSGTFVVIGMDGNLYSEEVRTMNITVARDILKEYGLDLDFIEGKARSNARETATRVQAVNPITLRRIDLMSFTVFKQVGHKDFSIIVAREVAGAK